MLAERNGADDGEGHRRRLGPTALSCADLSPLGPVGRAGVSRPASRRQRSAPRPHGRPGLQPALSGWPSCALSCWVPLCVVTFPVKNAGHCRRGSDGWGRCGAHRRVCISYVWYVVCACVCVILYSQQCVCLEIHSLWSAGMKRSKPLLPAQTNHVLSPFCPPPSRGGCASWTPDHRMHLRTSACPLCDGDVCV